MELAIFLLFAAFALGSAVVVVLHRDPVKATMSLVLTLFSTAVLFVLLGAQFIGVLQVLVYTGAIVVLFLFVIMLLNLQREDQPHDTGRLLRGLVVLAGLGFLAITSVGLWRAAGDHEMEPLTEGYVALKALSLELFDVYLLPFEIIGLLLLVAVVGAYLLAKRPHEQTTAGGGDDRPEAP